jgi:tetratricopeptide (TPR) repeat protein
LPFFHNGNDIAFASRFTYLPAIVPSIVAALLIFNVYSLVSWRWQRYLVIFLAVASLSYYGYMTQRLIGVWNNSGTYWSRVIEVKPLGRAYEGRGYYLYTQGRYNEAIDDFTKAIDVASRLRLPMMYNLYAHRGEAFRSAERYVEAVDDFTIAIMLRPEPNYYFHRGISFGAMGKLKEAEEDLARAGTETGPLEWYQADRR